MKSKVKDYQGKAKQRENRARATRDPENREWQTILARAYLILAEAESELGSVVI